MLKVTVMNITKWLATAIVSLSLFACGGGGGSPGVQTGSAGVPLAGPAIGVGLFNSAGAAITTIAAAENNFAAAKIADGLGNPIAGKIVTFSVVNAALVTLFPPDGTALTDSKGVASILITPAPGTSGGATSLQATALIGTAPITANTDFGISPARPIPQPVVQLALFDGANRSVLTIGTAPGHYALAKVLTGSGSAVTNRLVKFTLGNAALVRMDPPDGSAVTDSAGNARVGLSVLSGSVGGATSLVVEAATGDATPANGRVDFAALAFPIIQTPQTTLVLSLRNQSGAIVNTVSNSAGNFVLARLADSTGAPIVNRVVTLSTARAGVIFFPPDGTGLTNSNGEVRVSVSSAPGQISGAGTIAGSASLDAVAQVIVARLDVAVSAEPTATTIPPRLDLSITNASGQAVSSVSVSSQVFLRARVLDGAGSPVVGRKVTFSLGSESVITAFTPSDGTALTNAQGVASVELAPTSAGVSGARTVAATSLVGVADVSASRDFAVISTGVSVVNVPTISVRVFDRSGIATTNVSAAAGNVARALFVDGNARPLGGRRVSFSLSSQDASLATLTPTSGTALTDVSGFASIQISPVSLSSAGAITIVASALADSGAVQGQVDVSVSASAIELTELTLGSTNLLSGANTPVAITARLVNGGAGAAGVNVVFSATCGQIQSVVIANGSGVANATYSGVLPDGSLCSGPVTINAVALGAVSRVATLVIAAPKANAITFIDPSFTQIFVKSSGAREQTVVQFKVFAGTVPMANEPVVFSLGINPTASSLGLAGSAADVVVTTDSLGVASAPVFAGAIPGPLEVKATLQANTAVFTVSRDLTVASGPPSQRYFSMSIQTNNIEGHQREGTPNRVTVRVADRQGNPVPDGTVINFSAEGGQIGRSCSTRIVLPDGAGPLVLPNNGVATCSVGFVSQFPRPDNRRVSVLAYAEGVKDFVDLNGNNQYDPGIDTLVDMGDAYRDDDETQAFESGEFVIPKLGTLPCAVLPIPVPFAIAPTPSRQNTCTGQTVQQATVRDQRIIMFSSSSSLILFDGSSGVATVSSRNFPASTAVGVADAAAVQSLLPMPFGTVVSGASPVDGCTVTVGSNTVPNLVAAALGVDNRTRHPVTFKQCPSGAPFTLTTTTAEGLAVTTYGFTVP